MSEVPRDARVEAHWTQGRLRIFRHRAVEHYRQAQERTAFPKLVDRRLLRGLWAAVAAVTALTWWVAQIEIAVVVEGPAMVQVADGGPPAGRLVHVLVPADQARRPHVGQRLELSPGGSPASEPQRQGTIVSVTDRILTPAEGRSTFAWVRELEVPLEGPQVSVYAQLADPPPAGSAPDGVARARITLGRRSLASFLRGPGSRLQPVSQPAAEPAP